MATLKETLAAATKKAEAAAKEAATLAKKAEATGATEADKLAASNAAQAASAAASEAKEAQAAIDAAAEGGDTTEGNGKAVPITRILNLSSALHYVGETRILPDNIGSPFSDEEHAEASKNPGYLALLKAGKLKVE